MRTSFEPNHYNADADATCDNCGHVERAGNCNPIVDPGQRLCTGDPCPAGECTKCGSLSYGGGRTKKPRVVQAFIDPADMEIDDDNAYVIWIEIPDGCELTATASFTVTDTDMKIDAPGIDMHIREKI